MDYQRYNVKLLVHNTLLIAILLATIIGCIAMALKYTQEHEEPEAATNTLVIQPPFETNDPNTREYAERLNSHYLQRKMREHLERAITPSPIERGTPPVVMPPRHFGITK